MRKTFHRSDYEGRRGTGSGSPLKMRYRVKQKKRIKNAAINAAINAAGLRFFF